MSRAYRVENRLQSACDAATLAGRRAVTTNGFDATAQIQAANYFATNFDDSTQETTGTTKTFSSPDNGNTVNGTASTSLNLSVMKIFGFNAFTLSVNCQSTMGVGNSDVVMVLDTTGSMTSSLGSGTRISALQTAMKNFYTTVQNASSGTNARIRYGFVPFSTTVNVGRLLYNLNPAYLVDNWTIQSRLAVQTGTSSSTTNVANGTKTDYSSTTYSSSSSCNSALPTTTPWTNNGAASNLGTTSTTNSPYQKWTTTVDQPQQRTVYECYSMTSGRSTVYKIRYYSQTQDYDTNTTWQWSYQPVTYDVSAFKTFALVSTSTGNYGGSVSSSWGGCIEERSTTAAAAFSYSSTFGMSPATNDLDIDTAPTSDASTKWAPMWPTVAYYRSTTGNSTSGSQATSYCPVQAQGLQTMTQAAFNAYAGSLAAQGSTYLDIGMLWGGRLSSPTGIFQSTVNDAPTNGGEVSRHLIFMTDGIMEPSQSIQQSYGIESLDRRITTDGSNSQDTARHTSRFLATCAAVKAKGIRVWTISFTAGDNPDLQTCASANSYFNASDATALNNAFQQIAKQVGELRLSQ